MCFCDLNFLYFGQELNQNKNNVATSQEPPPPKKKKRNLLKLVSRLADFMCAFWYP